MPVFMPIFIKNPDWHQSPTNITIRLPSYGVPKNDIDLLTHELYIKAHYQQYIFEIFLWKAIVVSKCMCTVTDTEIIFELTKNLEQNWENLEADLDKPAKRDLRKQIIEEIQQRTQEECKQKVNKKAEMKRVAVKDQMAAELRKQDIIKNLKKTEEEKALKEMNLWEKEQSNKGLIIKDVTSNIIECKKSNDKSKYKSTSTVSNKEKVQEVNRSIRYSEYPIDKKIENKISPVIPMPRQCKTINISFTAREFPTPIRESKLPEEEEWIAKQAAARRAVGFDSADLRPEERNPFWLKQKGDEFFKLKNYLGAISAYSEGIKLSRDYADLYVNRSAVHFIVGNIHRTIEDCTTALEIMKPPVPANLDMRAICIARRGAALYKMNLVKQGMNEIDIALELVANKEHIKQEIEILKHELVISPN